MFYSSFSPPKKKPNYIDFFRGGIDFQAPLAWYCKKPVPRPSLDSDLEQQTPEYFLLIVRLSCCGHHFRRFTEGMGWKY